MIFINNKNEKKELGIAVAEGEHQAVVSITALLKAYRLHALMEQVKRIDFNKSNAMLELKKLSESIEKLLETNRGGTDGIHGFIGERAQVFLSNAKEIMRGNKPPYLLTDDNGMTDYLFLGIDVQQKACKSGGKLGLDHIMKHGIKYPEFNGLYEIPKDFYEKYAFLASLNQEAAGKLSRNEWNLWNEIQKVKQAGIKIKPMCVNYDEIQRDTIGATINKAKIDIGTDANQQKVQAQHHFRPTAIQCVKISAVSAFSEGILSGTGEMIKKRIDGTKISAYSAEDIHDVHLASYKGMGIGAIRGASVYIAENYTKIPGEYASGAITIATSSVSSIVKCKKGNITKSECAEQIGKSVAVTSAGILGAKIGKTLCKKVPIVGEILGSILGSAVIDKGYDFIKILINNQKNDGKESA